LDVPEAECVSRLSQRDSTGKGRPQQQVLANVRPQVERFEAPVEREGFRTIVKLKAEATAAQELIRRWTEESATPLTEHGPADSHAVHQGQQQAHHQGVLSGVSDYLPEEEEIRPPPPPTLSQWIEGCPVDAPLDRPLDGFVGDRPSAGSSLRGRADCSSRQSPADAPSGAATGSRAPGGGRSWRSPPSDMSCGLGGLQSIGESRQAWHPLEPQAPIHGRQPAHEPQPPVPTHQDVQDAEECARQEQLAATLRCMGFDEEPSLNAALHAGGNLNVAIESVLRNSSSSAAG